MNRIWRICRLLNTTKVHYFILVMCEEERCSLQVRNADPDLINKSIKSLHSEKNN